MALKLCNLVAVTAILLLAVPSYGAMALKPQLLWLLIADNPLAVPSYGAMALKRLASW